MELFLVDLLLYFRGPAPYFIIFFILFVCGLGLPIPEDVTLLMAGLSAYFGLTDIVLVTLVSYAGVMIGDGLTFFLGRHVGPRLASRSPLSRFLTAERLKVAEQSFQEKGNRLIFMGRFMPGLRAPLFFTAGVLGISPWIFFLFDGLAALVSVPAITGVIYVFGDELEVIWGLIQKVEHGIIVVVVLVVVYWIYKWRYGKR